MSIFIDTLGEQNGFVLEQFTGVQRKKPFMLALGIHLLVLVFMVLPADFFKADRNLEEIYTVDLFETPDAAPLKQLAPPAPPVQKNVPTPPPPKPVTPEKISTAAPVEPSVIPSGEIISLQPRMIKKELKEKQLTRNEQQKVDSNLARLKNQLNRNEAERNAREAQVAAAAAVDKALTTLRDSIHFQNVASSTEATSKPSAVSPSSTGSGSSSVMDAASKLYFVAVQQQIQSHWILPELQDWKQDLKAVVVVYVRRDGIVTKHFFEQKSDNLFFNQFVEKTLNESLPLPPFPRDLKEDNLEIGLVFHPSGLQ